MKLLLSLLSLFMFYGISTAQTYQIGQRSESVVDPQRSRNIPTEIFYPATQAGNATPVASGEFPLIVFGHGFSMNFGPYQNFVNEFVPKGYIIVFPKTEVGPIPFPDHGAFGADLSFMADYFQAQVNDPNALFFQVINGKTAVMGHSMGGGCSFLAAEQNSNINVIATFAAAETNVSAIGAAQNVAIPALVFAGGEDNVAPPAGNQIDMYNSLSSDCKYLITLDGGSHCGFGNSSGTCDFGETTVCLFCSFISRAEQHARTFSVLAPWLDFHLKSECSRWTDFELALQNTTDISTQSNCNYSLPEADFQAQGDSTFCEGDSILLNTNSTLKKKWSTNDTIANISIQNSGQYFLVVEDQYNCKDTSRTIDVAVNQAAGVNFNLPDTSFCGKDSVELQLQGNYNSISWQGTTGNSFWISESGSYTVEVLDTNNCANSDSIEITLSKLSPGFLPELIVKPTDNPCAGENVFIAMTDTLDGSVFWNIGSNQQEINIDTAGTFFVLRTDSLGCTYYSDTVEIAFNDLPSAMLDTLGDSLFVNSPDDFAQIFWFLNGTIALPQNQNLPAISPDTSGFYTVTFVDSNGCSVQTSALFFEYFEEIQDSSNNDSTILSLSTIDFIDLKIYPNPVSDQLLIESSKTYDYRLVDLSGKIHFNGILNIGRNQINTSQLSKGVYFLQVNEEKNNQKTYKLLKY